MLLICACIFTLIAHQLPVIAIRCWADVFRVFVKRIDCFFLSIFLHFNFESKLKMQPLRFRIANSTHPSTIRRTQYLYLQPVKYVRAILIELNLRIEFNLARHALLVNLHSIHSILASQSDFRQRMASANGGAEKIEYSNFVGSLKAKNVGSIVASRR